MVDFKDVLLFFILHSCRLKHLGLGGITEKKSSLTALIMSITHILLILTGTVNINNIIYNSVPYLHSSQVAELLAATSVA